MESKNTLIVLVKLDCHTKNNETRPLSDTIKGLNQNGSKTLI